MAGVCGFSTLRKVQTDQRSSLSQSTIVALMSIKFNNECCCCDLELPEDLLKDCKKATTLAVKNGAYADFLKGGLLL